MEFSSAYAALGIQYHIELGLSYHDIISDIKHRKLFDIASLIIMYIAYLFSKVYMCERRTSRLRSRNRFSVLSPRTWVHTYLGRWYIYWECIDLPGMFRLYKTNNIHSARDHALP